MGIRDTTRALRDETAAEALLGAHVPRTLADLRTEIACHVLRLVPNATAAVLVQSVNGDSYDVLLRIGDACPFAEGAPVQATAWQAPDLRRIPIPYGSHIAGWLLLQEPVPNSAELEALAPHWGIAFVNLRLNEEALRTTDQYCATLQVLHEAFALLSEPDAEHAAASFLMLGQTLMHADAGALWLADAHGEPQLRQVVGIPEALVAALRAEDGTSWPRRLLGGPLLPLQRDPRGRLAGLDPTTAPPQLRDVVVGPLRHRGRPVGLVVFFNQGVDVHALPSRMYSLRYLTELGAALFARKG